MPCRKHILSRLKAHCMCHPEDTAYSSAHPWRFAAPLRYSEQHARSQAGFVTEINTDESIWVSCRSHLLTSSCPAFGIDRFPKCKQPSTSHHHCVVRTQQKEHGSGVVRCYAAARRLTAAHGHERPARHGHQRHPRLRWQQERNSQRRKPVLKRASKRSRRLPPRHLRAAPERVQVPDR